MSAQYVAIGGALLATIACVISAFASWRASAAANKLRSMTSLHAELHEMRDYMVKVDAWSKRLNQRLVMAERRATASEEPEADTPTRRGAARSLGTVSKDELRRIAGLTAGQYPKHGN